jgi:hypothetical protein
MAGDKSSTPPPAGTDRTGAAGSLVLGRRREGGRLLLLPVTVDVVRDVRALQHPGRVVNPHVEAALAERRCFDNLQRAGNLT